MAVEHLLPFRKVEGIPRGGMKFAEALRPYAKPDAGLLLLADDVLTTGESMERARAGGTYVIGVVAFARGPWPKWVTPLFVDERLLAFQEHERGVAALDRGDFVTLAELETIVNAKPPPGQRSIAHRAGVIAVARRAIKTIDGLQARVTVLEGVLRDAHAHIEELRGAWERGTISEHDGKGGLRSNRNADVERQLRTVLKKPGQRQ